MINRFRFIVVIKVILLLGLLFSAFLLISHFDNRILQFIGILLGISGVYTCLTLISFVEKTNRDLTRFMESLKNDDFTQNFSDNRMGKSFRELKQSFDEVKEQFLELRSQKEEHARYLQTVIRHIGSGIIVYKGDGQVELINTFARKMFRISHLKDIQSLEHISQELVNALMTIKAGETVSIKLYLEDEEMYLSINSTQFRMKSGSYTLVSIQNIKHQIDMENMSKELEIAWEVQKTLLPGESPEIPGYDIEGICKPAKEVGGDYYDFISAGKNRLAIIIGDVSGKGTSASFYMTLTKGFIQSTLTDEDVTAAEILKRVNQLMFDTINRKSFVTMFITILDWNSGVADCARAGHNPAILYKSPGSTQLIKPGGVALGLVNNREFSKSLKEFSFEFHEGDILLMYTDGFVEIMNDEDTREFGEEGLKSCVTHNSEMSSIEIVEAICHETDSFNSSREQYDDMTMVCIKKSKKMS